MAKKTKSDSGKRKEALPPTTIPQIDGLEALVDCRIKDYVVAVSAYVREHSKLSAGQKKAGQIRLSHALGRSLSAALKDSLPLDDLFVGERKVAGALRTAKADVSEFSQLDGVRLAIELKPVNLAVGRAIWNRFGDLRTFAVNVHLKFPFAVVGGVLVIPTSEQVGTVEAKKAEGLERAEEIDRAIEIVSTDELELTEGPDEEEPDQVAPSTKSTRHLIERAVQRLVRAGGRQNEGAAPHLLEAISVVVYDPLTGIIDEDLPAKGSNLRWEEFVAQLVAAYKGRFED